MKAVSIYGPEDIRMIEVEKPKVGPRDVLTRVKYCGICGTDVAILKGETYLVREKLIRYPVRIGHEWSGIVEEVGCQVQGIKPGDKVIGDDVVTCGYCPACKRGDYSSCENFRSVGTVNCWDGAFAEYIVMPYRHVFKIPDDARLDEYVLTEPSAIAYFGLLKTGIAFGSSVLVIGTGSIGLAAVGIAGNMGASKALLSGRRASKLAAGKAMGADIVINSTKEDLARKVKEATDGKGADIVLETSGNIVTINQALDCVRPGGSVGLVGFYEQDFKSLNVDKMVINNVAIKGISGALNAFPPVIEMIKAGKLSLKPLITDRYAFNDIFNAFKAADESSETRIKVVVEM